MDGFDHYANVAGGSAAAQLQFKWTNSLGIAMDAAHFTTGSQYARGTGQGLLTNVAGANWGVYKTIASNPATLITGCAFFWISTPQSSTPLLSFMDSATQQLTLTTDGSMHLRVDRGPGGGTTLATSTNTLSLNTWFYIEFKATINGSTGVIEVRVNGTSTGWIPSTGSLNTQQTGNASTNGVLIGGGSASTQVDDFYICDTTGSVNTNFLGPVRVAPLAPAQAGNYAQWTPNAGANFSNVNDLPQPDGDTTFNQSSTAGQLDSYIYDDVPATSGTVFAIQHNIFARQDAGAQRTIARLIRRASTDYVGTSQNTGTSYTYYLQVDETDPNTSAAWTVANVNAAEFGVKLIS